MGLFSLIGKSARKNLNEKTGLTRKNLHYMRTALHLEKEMAKRLGASQIL